MMELVGSKVSEGGVALERISEENKLSSSDVRRSLLGQYRKPRVRHGTVEKVMLSHNSRFHSFASQVDECLDYDPQSGPFLIGLTGAIATGKSSVLARLVKLGAYPIDCDKVFTLHAVI